MRTLVLLLLECSEINRLDQTLVNFETQLHTVIKVLRNIILDHTWDIMNNHGQRFQHSSSNSRNWILESLWSDKSIDCVLHLLSRNSLIAEISETLSRHESGVIFSTIQVVDDWGRHLGIIVNLENYSDTLRNDVVQRFVILLTFLEQELSDIKNLVGSCLGVLESLLQSIEGQVTLLVGGNLTLNCPNEFLDIETGNSSITLGSMNLNLVSALLLALDEVRHSLDDIGVPTQVIVLSKVANHVQGKLSYVHRIRFIEGSRWEVLNDAGLLLAGEWLNQLGENNGERVDALFVDLLLNELDDFIRVLFLGYQGEKIEKTLGLLDGLVLQVIRLAQLNGFLEYLVN